MREHSNSIINEFILQNVLKQSVEGTQHELSCHYISYTFEVNKVYFELLPFLSNTVLPEMPLAKWQAGWTVKRLMNFLTNRRLFGEEFLLWQKDSELVRCKLWKGNEDRSPPDELWKMLWESGQGCRQSETRLSAAIWSASNFLPGQSEIHFDHFWTDSNNNTEREICGVRSWVGGMVRAWTSVQSCGMPSAILISKILLFSN